MGFGAVTTGMGAPSVPSEAPHCRTSRSRPHFLHKIAMLCSKQGSQSAKTCIFCIQNQDGLHNCQPFWHHTLLQRHVIGTGSRASGTCWHSFYSSSRTCKRQSTVGQHRTTYLRARWGTACSPAWLVPASRSKESCRGWTKAGCDRWLNSCWLSSIKGTSGRVCWMPASIPDAMSCRGGCKDSLYQHLSHMFICADGGAAMSCCAKGKTALNPE